MSSNGSQEVKTEEETTPMWKHRNFWVAVVVVVVVVGGGWWYYNKNNSNSSGSSGAVEGGLNVNRIR